MSTTNHAFRPDIEGLRALAVLLVLVYHTGLGFHGGFIGVDVFLVVSGFLITSLLLREAESGRISLAAFWGRRARRLLAASTLVAGTTMLAGFLLLEPSRIAGLAADAVAAGTFSSNIRFAVTNSDYLSGLALPSPLLHFWSLALEEQFYLVWPVLLTVALRARSFRRVLAVAVVALGAASLLASALLTRDNPSFSYYLLPTRAWELLLGAGLAMLPVALSRIPVIVRSMLGFTGGFAVVFAALQFGHETVFPGLAALVPVLGTAALLVAGQGSLPGRVLSLRPLQWVGARSYSVYLWHWPVFVIYESRFGSLTPVSASLLIAGSFLLADVTFRFVENPVRSNKVLSAHPGRSVAFGGSLAAFSIIAGLCLGAVAPAVSTVTLTANANLPVSGTAPTSVTPSSGGLAGGSVAGADIGSATDAPVATLPVVTTAPVVPVGRVLLIGDSTLAPLRWFESGLAGVSGFDYVLDAESCRRISLSSCRGREERTPRSVVPVLDSLTEENDHFDTIVLMGGYHSDEGSILREFDDLVAAVRRHGASRLVVLDWRESLAFPLAGSRGKVSVYTRFNEIIRGALSSGKYPEVTLLGWHAFTASHPEWFRSDGVHVDLAGALVLGEFLSDHLAALDGRPCPGDPGTTICVPAVTAPARDVLAEYNIADTDLHCYELGKSRTKACRKDKLA